MLAIPSIGALARWTTYPPPSDDDLRQAVADEMVENHPELEGLLNYTKWDVELSDFYNGTKFKLRASWVDESNTYELVWIGFVSWSKWLPDISVIEVYYQYEVYITVAKVGPGTTVDSPGVYHVDGGTEYSFEAVASYSDDEDWKFVFLRWEIWDGYTNREETDPTLTGTAYTDLTITAIFEAQVVPSCKLVFEDGLNMGYLWRDDHAVLAIRTRGASTIIVSINSEYGTYDRVFNVHVRSLVIYFSPQWFTGDYDLIVIGDMLNPLPSYQLAGLD